MNHPDIIPTTSQSIIKAYKCETCETTYSDKMYYDLHRQSHQKDMPAVLQIVMGNNHQQAIPQATLQPAPTHQPQQQVIIQDEQQLAALKRAYGVEPQQVYALAPATQFQVIAGNNGGNVSVGNQLTYSSAQQYTPTYVVAGTINEHCQLQPIQDPNMLQAHHIQLADIMPTSVIPHDNHVEVQVQHAPMSRATSSKANRATTVNGPAERPYKCDQCTASFIDGGELEEHKKKHTGDGPFTCEDCHFTFMYKSHFRSHKTRCLKKRALMPQTSKSIILNTDSVKRTFPTNSLDHTLKQAHPLSSIVANNLNVSVKSFNQRDISVGKSSFSHKGRQSSARFNPTNPSFKSFKKVRRESRLDRPYECDECDASFQNDADLRTHKTKHTGEGPFKCEECRFVFLYRKLYEAHRRRCEKKRTTVKTATSSTPVESVVSQNNAQSNSSSDELDHSVTVSIPVEHRIEENHIHSQPMASSAQSQSQVVSHANSMQLHISGQPAVIEMRPVDNSMQELSQHTQVLDQVVLGEGDQQIKYDLVASEGMDLSNVNVNQIMNLIKSKGRYSR